MGYKEYPCPTPVPRPGQLPTHSVKDILNAKVCFPFIFSLATGRKLACRESSSAGEKFLSLQPIGDFACRGLVKVPCEEWSLEKDKVTSLGRWLLVEAIIYPDVTVAR